MVWNAHLSRCKVWFLTDIKAIIANIVQKNKTNQKTLHLFTLKYEKNKENI